MRIIMPRISTPFYGYSICVILSGLESKLNSGYNLNYNSQLLHLIGCDSSVGIALGYGLDDRGSRVRFPAGTGNFCLHHRVQNGSGTHTASYPIGTRLSFSGGKVVGV
jgi:hypothetical protein